MKQQVQTHMELLLNSNKIRYNKLSEMVKDIKINRIVNIYIDVNSLFDILYRTNNLEHFRTIDRDDNLTISSQVINTIAHYRHYFYSRHQVSTVFYLLYSNDVPSRYYTNLFPNYKKTYNSLRIEKQGKKPPLQENIERNMRLVNNICKYIPDAFLINVGRNDIGGTMQYLINTETNTSCTNLIYTNDKNYYQLVNNENTYVILNKQEHSKFISKGNLYKVLTKKDEYNDIPSELYKIILALTGNKKYDVPGIRGVQTIKALKLIRKAIDQDIIYNTEYDSISSVLDNLIKYKIIPEENREVVERNFKLFNISMIAKTLSEAYMDNIDSQMVTNTDYDQLMFVSNKYYQYQPLMFLELVETFNK